MIDLTILQKEIHQNAKNKGFWELVPNIAEKLALVHSEVSEVLEELRQQAYSSENFGNELADIIIRVFDIAEHEGLILIDFIEQKHKQNLNRPYKHGKRF